MYTFCMRYDTSFVQIYIAFLFAVTNIHARTRAISGKRSRIYSSLDDHEY